MVAVVPSPHTHQPPPHIQDNGGGGGSTLPPSSQIKAPNKGREGLVTGRRGKQKKYVRPCGHRHGLEKRRRLLLQGCSRWEDSPGAILQRYYGQNGYLSSVDGVASTTNQICQGPLRCSISKL